MLIEYAFYYLKGYVTGFPATMVSIAYSILKSNLKIIKKKERIRIILFVFQIIEMHHKSAACEKQVGGKKNGKE